MTTLLIANKEIDDIIGVIKFIEESGWFPNMLLENVLAGKYVKALKFSNIYNWEAMLAGEGKIRADENTV